MPLGVRVLKVQKKSFYIWNAFTLDNQELKIQLWNVFGAPKLVVFLDFLGTILVKIIKVTFVLVIDFNSGLEYLIHTIYLLPLFF